MQLIYAHSSLFMPENTVRGCIDPSRKLDRYFVEMAGIHVDYAVTAPTDRAMRIYWLRETRECTTIIAIGATMRWSNLIDTGQPSALGQPNTLSDDIRVYATASRLIKDVVRSPFDTAAAFVFQNS